MGLITKEVEVTPHGRMIPYYRDLGYCFKYGDTIKVNIGDLPKGSNKKVECTCDYCGKTISCTYYDYNVHINAITNKIACKECACLKTSESVQKKYGVDSIFRLPETQEKIRQTNIENLGCEYPTQNEEVKRKVRESVKNRYNCDSVMQVPEIKERMCNTNVIRYGHPYALQNPIIHAKAINTLYTNYQVCNPSQNTVLREKAVQSLYSNGTVNTSRQQKYICDLYNMKLNYPVLYWNVDMYDELNKLIVEADFGGHDLSVRLGNMTQKEFDQKEIVRNNMIKRNGYKMMRIISRKDWIPSDEILLQMLSDAKQYFSSFPKHSWISFDIDNNIVRNAEHKDGSPYSYGQLRRIKKQNTETA